MSPTSTKGREINGAAKLATVRTNVDTLMVQVPALALRSDEARDIARSAAQQIDTHMDDDDAHLRHVCDEKDRQAEQDRDIESLKPQVSGLSRWRWALMSGLLAVAFSVVTWGIASAERAATARAQLDALDDVPRAVTRHDERLSALEKTSRELLAEVRRLPAEIVKRTDEQGTDLVRARRALYSIDALSPGERRRIERILQTAEERK